MPALPTKQGDSTTRRQKRVGATGEVIHDTAAYCKSIAIFPARIDRALVAG